MSAGTGMPRFFQFRYQALPLSCGWWGWEIETGYDISL